MNGPLRAVWRVLLDGLMVVVLPTGAVVLLALGIAHRLQDVADPLAGRYVHPALMAGLLLLLLCLAVGLLVRSTAGRWAQRRLERALFDRIPGCRLLRAFAGDALPALGAEGRRPPPVLARIEDGLCPAFVVDRFADGRVLVFVPGAPAVLSGALYIFPPERVVPLDVPVFGFARSISSWGFGLRELIEQAEGRQRLPSGSGSALP